MFGQKQPEGGHVLGYLFTAWLHTAQLTTATVVLLSLSPPVSVVTTVVLIATINADDSVLVVRQASPHGTNLKTRSAHATREDVG